MRYVVTLVVAGIVTIVSDVGLMLTDPTRGNIYVFLAGVGGYAFGLLGLLAARGAFARLNRDNSPPWQWALAGVVPVLLIGLVAKGFLGTLLVGAILGSIMAAAILSPTLRRRS